MTLLILLRDIMVKTLFDILRQVQSVFNMFGMTWLVLHNKILRGQNTMARWCVEPLRHLVIKTPKPLSTCYFDSSSRTL